MLGLEFWVSGLWFGASGFGFRVYGLGVWSDESPRAAEALNHVFFTTCRDPTHASLLPKLERHT